MKGSIKFSGEILEYYPEDLPFRKGYRDIVLNAVKELENLGELPYAPNIRNLTKARRTCVQNHLNALVKDGLLKVRYAKIRMTGSTVIAGVYSSKLDKPNKNKNKKKKSKR